MKARLADDRPLDERLQVQCYDRFAAGLITLLVLLGTADSVALLMWLEPLVAIRTPPVCRPMRIERVGQEDPGGAVGLEIETPGTDELAEFIEPDFAQLLESVTEVVASTQAAFALLPRSGTESAGEPEEGDDRQDGSPDFGTGIVPAWDRWELRFAATSLDEYARQLDQLGIELGAIGGGRSRVDYASHFTGAVRRRQGKGSAEDRLYFSHAAGRLDQFERRLLQRAGIEVAHRITVQFIPHELEQELLRKELSHATSRTDPTTMSKKEQMRVLATIARTVFALRPAGGGRYEFAVVSQRYRDPPGE